MVKTIVIPKPLSSYAAPEVSLDVIDPNVPTLNLPGTEDSDDVTSESGSIQLEAGAAGMLQVCQSLVYICVVLSSRRLIILQYY